MATIKDVAKKAGVSVTTVSRVLNNTAPVNEKTREMILKAIEELAYTPSVMAQGMRTKKTRTIGVIIPDYMNPFYFELFKHIEEEAKKEGYHVIVASVDEDNSSEVSHINDLLSRSIDGIIICTYKGDKETVDYLLRLSKKMPVVFMDNLDVKKSLINCVYTDAYMGVKKVTKHLIELGYKKIAFIKSLTNYKTANERYDGFLDAMKEAKVEVKDEYIYEGNYKINSGYEAAKYFLSREKDKPNAIVSSTDFMAIGVMNYVKSQGLRIPEDIAVAGYDDIYISRLMSPPITTYRQPIENIAREAIKIIINKCIHPNAKNKQIVLCGELLIRKSTCPDKFDVETL